jgi:hypothetical protein
MEVNISLIKKLFQAISTEELNFGEKIEQTKFAEYKGD